jgi:hypothetical protein
VNAVHLGELLAFREQSSEALQRWLAGHDRELASRMSEQAALRGETLAHFVRDPGARCVEKMVAFRVKLERAT